MIGILILIYFFNNDLKSNYCLDGSDEAKSHKRKLFESSQEARAHERKLYNGNKHL